jgi:hypothetical protein
VPVTPPTRRTGRQLGHGKVVRHPGTRARHRRIPWGTRHTANLSCARTAPATQHAHTTDSAATTRWAPLLDQQHPTVTADPTGQPSPRSSTGSTAPAAAYPPSSTKSPRPRPPNRQPRPAASTTASATPFPHSPPTGGPTNHPPTAMPPPPAWRLDQHCLLDSPRRDEKPQHHGTAAPSSQKYRRPLSPNGFKICLLPWRRPTGHREQTCSQISSGHAHRAGRVPRHPPELHPGPPTGPQHLTAPRCDAPSGPCAGPTPSRPHYRHTLPMPASPTAGKSLSAVNCDTRTKTDLRSFRTGNVTPQVRRLPLGVSYCSTPTRHA